MLKNVLKNTKKKETRDKNIRLAILMCVVCRRFVGSKFYPICSSRTSCRLPWTQSPCVDAILQEIEINFLSFYDACNLDGWMVGCDRYYLKLLLEMRFAISLNFYLRIAEVRNALNILRSKTFQFKWTFKFKIIKIMFKITEIIRNHPNNFPKTTLPSDTYHH